MTSEGLNRMAELFANEIDKIAYDKEGSLVEKQITSNDISIQNNKVTVYLIISSKENGTIDNFRLIGKTGITLATEAISFSKVNSEIIIDFPYLIVSEEV